MACALTFDAFALWSYESGEEVRMGQLSIRKSVAGLRQTATRLSAWVLASRLWGSCDQRLVLVDFDDTGKRLVESLDPRSIAQAVQDKPRGFLPDPQIPGERRRGDALGMIGDKPNRREPLLQGQFRVFKNRSDSDREVDAALGALEKTAPFAKLVNLVVAAMWAIFAIPPANCPKMLDTGGFVRKCPEQVNEAFKMLHFWLPESLVYYGPRIGLCQAGLCRG